jgi:hypothetical protein
MAQRHRRAWLRAFMRRHKLKAPDIARALSRKPQTVRAWLCGARDVPRDAVGLIIASFPAPR